MRAADAGERALVAQERVKLAALPPQDLCEPLGADSEGVWAEVRELGLECVRVQQPDPGPLLLPGLGQDQLGAVGEAEPEHRRLRRLCSRGVVAEAAGAHQVYAHHELPVLGREEQVLAAPPRPCEAPADERRGGWVERLQGGDVGRPGLLDGCARHERVELPHPRLDFRKFGQLRSRAWPTRSA